MGHFLSVYFFFAMWFGLLLAVLLPFPIFAFPEADTICVFMADRKTGGSAARFRVLDSTRGSSSSFTNYFYKAESKCITLAYQLFVQPGDQFQTIVQWSGQPERSCRNTTTYTPGAGQRNFGINLRNVNPLVCT
eukprot:NODE_1920_length_710_cov_214.521936_g1495_i0.p1 GENE.NODE_1920_length_710_cov_214.521936_g1495_i0~~NODE_1920_length_710_cov_214.521936_g1495_i0.p1  ORF type:complete len:134 (+),score=14.84 NODE_1920_length_710_cov_214.521936_g1495_i0:283-684(+)